MTISGARMDSRNPCNNSMPPQTLGPAAKILGICGVRLLIKSEIKGLHYGFGLKSFRHMINLELGEGRGARRLTAAG
jgi:hypothetical protein